MRRIILLIALATAVISALASTAAGRTAVSISTVAGRLDHPNGIAFARDGTMYVTEMGHGGDSCYAEPNFLGFGDLGPVCYGQTGAVTRIKNGHRDRIVQGLFSMGVLGGAVSVGAEDLTFDGSGRLLVVMAARAACQPTSVFAWWAQAQIGKVLWTTGKHLRVAADVGGRQCGRGMPSSFPAGLATAGDRLYVADGGSGEMLLMRGKTFRSLGSVKGTFPLSAAIGPDGAVYAGVCNCDGTGKVIRYAPGKPPAIIADGLGWVSGIAFAPDGTLYVSDIHFDEKDQTAAHGELLRIGKKGAVTTVVPQGRLEWPGHIAFGPDGALYVVNHVHWSAAGEILRIKL